MRHIASIWAINTTSFLRSLQIQLTSSNATTLRPTGLEPTRTASSLPPLNVTSFDLVTSWSVRRSEVRSGGWKNNRRENPIVFLIAFSLTTNWDLRLIHASSVHPEYPTRVTCRAVGTGFEVDLFTILKALYPTGQPARPGKAGHISQDKQLETVEHLETVKHLETVENLETSTLRPSRRLRPSGVTRPLKLSRLLRSSKRAPGSYIWRRASSSDADSLAPDIVY